MALLFFFIRQKMLDNRETVREWMNQGVKDMGLYLCFAFSGAKDR